MNEKKGKEIIIGEKAQKSQYNNILRELHIIYDIVAYFDRLRLAGQNIENSRGSQRLNESSIYRNSFRERTEARKEIEFLGQCHLNRQVVHRVQAGAARNHARGVTQGTEGETSARIEGVRVTLERNGRSIGG